MAERVARRYIGRMPVRDNTALSRFELDAGGVTTVAGADATTAAATPHAAGVDTSLGGLY